MQQTTINQEFVKEEVVLNKTLFAKPPTITDHARFCQCKACKEWYEEEPYILCLIPLCKNKSHDACIKQRCASHCKTMCKGKHGN